MSLSQHVDKYQMCFNTKIRQSDWFYRISAPRKRGNIATEFNGVDGDWTVGDCVIDLMETYKDGKTERQSGFWWSLKVVVAPPVASSSYYCGGGRAEGNTWTISYKHVLDCSLKPIMAGDCSLYVGIGAIGKSTTEQQSGVFALQIVLNHSVSIFIQIYTDLQILFSISQYGFIVQIYTIVKL